MPADTDPKSVFRPHLSGLAGLQRKPADQDQDDTEEESCAAFGYLRGLRDRALVIEFRLRTGDTESFPYNLLGSVRYNPSVGLLLKLTGDVVTLVLIRGSNLDAVIEGRGVNLTDRGLLRQRLTWVREMDEAEVRRVGEAGPTIDRIEVAEIESAEEQQAWLAKTVPAFLRE